MVGRRVSGSTLVEAIVASVVTLMVIIMGATMLSMPGRASREVLVVSEFTLDSLWSLPLQGSPAEQEHLFPWGRCVISVEPYGSSGRLFLRTGFTQTNLGAVLSKRKEVVDVKP